jgi:hypothetical protein
MAARYYGASVGASVPTDVAKAASTTGKEVEVVVNVAAGVEKLAVIKALLAITDYLIADAF